MKKYLKNVYDAGTIAFHYTILYSLYSAHDTIITKIYKNRKLIRIYTKLVSNKELKKILLVS